MATSYGRPADRPGARRHPAAVALCCAVLVIAALGACSRDEGPEAIAQSFLEQYYVHPNLGKAKTLAQGLALRKIEEGERLIRGLARPEDGGGRTVSYGLHTTRKVAEDRIFFVYDLTISVDSVVIKKRAFISTTKMKEGWRVTNFQEEDR